MTCTICGSTKEEHAGRQHEFTTDESPDLIPVEGARTTADRKPRPPMARESTVATDAHATRMILRIIEVLTTKGLLDDVDLLYIFGGKGNVAPGTHRQPTQSPGTGGDASGTE